SREENCRLILTNLPRGITEKTLLDALSLHRPLGRVWGCRVAPAALGSKTTTADLIMFTERDAQKVFFLVNRGRLAIGGLNTIIRYNTAHPIVPERPLAPLSRSLVFRGPKEIVDVHRLYRFLSSKMKFQTQDVYVADVNEEERIVEWVFASYQGQAQVAKAILKHEYPNLILRYGEDPMA
ncbi:hypothetical protein B0T20DRAFT_328114, partial [Sordaria brevicollis]